MEVYNVLVKLLDGKTATLKFSSPVISGESIKTNLYKITQIPPQYQRLVTGSRQINEETLITVPGNGGFYTVNLLGGLLGGKGGFGSLLRGAATKAGQKKTNNFDACRDMSGRRLRHVNAEKKLEEWKAEADERNLEKIAEDFLKKKAKEVRKSGSKESEKYIEKYREDSARCMDEVEASVRASFGLHQASKRKMLPTSGGSTSKRSKLTMKGKVDDTDSDSDDEDEKSVVLDDGRLAVKIKDGEGSSCSVSGGHSDGDDGSHASITKEGSLGSGSGLVSSSGLVSGAHSDGESSGGVSTESKLDGDNNGTVNTGGVEVGDISGCGEFHDVANGNVDSSSRSHEKEASGTEVAHEGNGPIEIESEINKGTADQSANVSNSLEVEAKESRVIMAETNVSSLEKPLNFDDFNSAMEMEGLGMERLKSELQSRGLKCGGTLQERAARLFLLKTTPLEKLPKKLLAKK